MIQCPINILFWAHFSALSLERPGPYIVYVGLLYTVHVWLHDTKADK